MRITSILPVIPEKLFRVVYNDSQVNILEILQEQWTDSEWLREFFKKFKKDLDALGEPFTINEAIRQTIRDADNLFETLLNHNGNNLSDIFKPLDNRETETTNNQAQKGRIDRPRTWLRLYAVHFEGRYIITGGAIKLTAKMDNRPHLKDELYKLKLLSNKLNLDIESRTLGYLDI
jgi:hypothetical protein